MPFLDSSKHLWRVWRANARASMVREMEFRSNFLLGLIRQFLWVGVFVFLIEVIFQNTESLAGWSKPEVLLILALSRIIEGTIDTFFSRNIAHLPQDVQNGEFDFNLVRPGSAQFYTAFRRFYFHNIGHLISGVIILLYALSQMPAPAPMSVTAFLILVAVSLTTFYSLLILLASLVFYFDRFETMWSIISLITEPLTVPFDIFPRSVRIPLTYFIPIAFVVFVPAQALTGRLELWQIPAAIGIAALFLLLANLAWRAGLRRYSSASS